MSDIKLEPCPFCRNEPQVVDDLLTFCVECSNCGACGPVSSYKAGAIEAWNRRAAVQANVPDAERYRWLRAALADRSVNGRSHWFCSIPENQPEWLDTEIDVAMLSAIQKG